MRRAIGAALVALLVGCSGGGDTSTSAVDDVGARQAALPTTTTQATTTVAPASQLLEVPDLVGQSVDYAEGALTAVGLVLVVETREDADSEIGVVLEQLPEAGAEMTANSLVIVRIASSSTVDTIAASTTQEPDVTTTTEEPDVRLDEAAVLALSYSWGSSDATATLQTLLGLPADGFYGHDTRQAHLDELRAMGLSFRGVPDPPTPTTAAQATAPTTTTAATTTTTAATTTTTVAPAETTTTATPSAPSRSLITICWDSWRQGGFLGPLGNVTLSWSAPIDEGSSPITHYIVTSVGGEFEAQAPGYIVLYDIPLETGVGATVKAYNAQSRFSYSHHYDNPPLEEELLEGYCTSGMNP